MTIIPMETQKRLNKLEELKKETKKKVLSPKQMNEEITWNRICEQLGHKRLHE